jgi:hypothetical protein
MSIGFSQRQTIFILYGACLIFGTLGLLVGASPPDIGVRVGLAGLFVLGGLFLLMMWIRVRYQKSQPPTVVSQ